MPTTRVYRSSDTGAPTLTGAGNSLANVLDKCLVSGYGASTAAGWTKPYTGTNTATFAQGSGSLGHFLHVNDNGPGVGTFKEARVWGTETASAVLTGTLLFPTAAQLANGCFIRKSVSADTIQRPWIVVADERTFYMFVLTGDSAGVYYPWGFGEYYSYKSITDTGRNFIIGRSTENSASVATTVDAFDGISQNWALMTGHYINRGPDAASGALQFTKTGNVGFTAAASPNPMNGLIGMSNQPDRKVYLAPVQTMTASPANAVRGRLRGIWHFCHPIAGVTDGDTFSGSGELSGKSFLIIKTLTNNGVACVETSSTWDSN